MSKAVVYHNYGTSCLVRLVVSLHTLRKVWDGNVVVLLEDKNGEKPIRPDWLTYCFNKYNVRWKEIYPSYKLRDMWARKPELWQYVSDDMNMYIDSDTVICKPIDGFFELIDKHDFVCCKYSHWTIHRIKTNQATQLGMVLDPKTPIINLGVFGWKKCASFLVPWMELARKAEKQGLFVPDELACYCLAARRKDYFLAQQYWNNSARVKHQLVDIPKFRRPDDYPRIFHFHGGRHFRQERGFVSHAQMWLSLVEEVMKDMPPSVCTALKRAWGDRYYERWIKKYGWRTRT